jgi:hypothetical protein
MKIRIFSLAAILLLAMALGACKGGGNNIDGIDIGGTWDWTNDYATGNDTDFEIKISGGASANWTGNINGDLSTLTTSGNAVHWVFNADDGQIVADGFYTGADNGRIVGSGTKTSGATVRNFTFSAHRKSFDF